jgi:hypothetical protein
LYTSLILFFGWPSLVCSIIVFSKHLYFNIKSSRNSSFVGHNGKLETPQS